MKGATEKTPAPCDCASLAENEAQLRLALDAGRMIAWDFDLTNGKRTLFGNIHDVLGLGAEHQNRRLDMDLIHPDDRAAIEEQLGRVLRMGSSPDTIFRFVRPDNGETVQLEGRCRAMRDESGRVVRLYGTLADVTERMQAAVLEERSRRLELENQRISQAARLKTELLNNMSHDLRTPLNAIIGFAELLHDGHVDPSAPEHREFLGDIIASGRRLLELVDKVLEGADKRL